MARFAVFALICAFIGPANAADIAIDVDSGSVLTATEADAPRLPASLTKLMTAYVAFEALAADDLTEATSVPVSGFAARRPPVKLGLRAGSDIRFGEVLGAAVVGSRNDAAAVVAEAVAGSEAAFVERMNVSAARLGMTNTRFANASGLPADGQHTTARDMAILSRALLTQFPRRSRLFSERSVVALGRRVSTTNPLFGRVKGAEGLKTGFTCAAGYSIAALVERDGRRVVAVTLGHARKQQRLTAIRGLIEAAFKLSDTGTALGSAPATGLPPPDIGACSGAPQTLIATDISPEEKALYAAELAKAQQRVVGTAPSPPQPPPSRSPDPVQVQPNRAAPSGYAVFLGAQRSRQNAEALLRAAQARLGSIGTPRIERRRRDGRLLAVLHGLDRESASRLCKSVDRYCVVLTPARLLNPKAQWRR